MQHRDIDQVCNFADIQPVPSPLMTRRERLERWAEVLGNDPKRRLETLGEIEFAGAVDRLFMRADNSPLTVALEDPALVAAGLKSDRLGDALTFFAISESEAQCIMCSCLYGWTTSAGAAAARVRNLDRMHWLIPAITLIGMSGAPVHWLIPTTALIGLFGAPLLLLYLTA
jgi:hypothetical protein